MSSSLEVWIAAALSLMVLSFLWRDNPAYKFAEHLFVGVSAGYWMVMGFWSTLWPNAVVKLVPSAARLTEPAGPVPAREPLVLVPLVLGILMLLRLWPRLSWLARWPTAFAVGTTLGYNLVRYVRSDFLAQIHATVAPGLLVTSGGAVNWVATCNQWLIVAGTASGVVYFTYTRGGAGLRGGVARGGLVVLMVAFGASFAYAVMARVAVLVGRLQFLLGDWLGLV
ncbi:MAG TPA: hypothetical protein PLL30_08105 [Candidatus Krumholzibacteria bacterium]|nr:hypothetical protein [Candidatus Krumholzibacteria bacterium]HPD71719.1 hypothetical protein [Candidatus Krumholzibacteria bacterium]HRY41348.1 hypothetical protein [Candidatus Krumholzibacteria bacterium]